jgi:hypothetical protein
MNDAAVAIPRVHIREEWRYDRRRLTGRASRSECGYSRAKADIAVVIDEQRIIRLSKKGDVESKTQGHESIIISAIQLTNICGIAAASRDDVGDQPPLSGPDRMLV